MKKFLFAAAITLTLSVKSVLHAQPAAVQQFQNFQINQPASVLPAPTTITNAPELYSGESTDVGPQHILRLTPRHKYFNLLLDSQVFYTDNANFAPTESKIGSAVFVNTIQTVITPRDIPLRNGKLSTSVGVASQWYNYDSESMDGLSFNAQTAFGGAKYAFGKWLLALDMSYTRLVSQPHYGLTYQELLPAFSVQRFIPLTDTLLVTVADQVDYHFSDEPTIAGTYSEINNRLDNIINVTFTWQAADKLYVQPGYRFVFTNYRYNTAQDSDRNDYLNSVGITVSYFFKENFSIRTFFNYSAKCSDDPAAAAYHETNEGVGASLNLLF